MNTVITFYLLFALFVITAALLPRYFYRHGYTNGIACEFLVMLTMLLTSGALLKATHTALTDLDPLLLTLLSGVLMSVADCGYLLLKSVQKS